MAIDWKSPENTERLLTCVYAWLQESNMPINHHRIAKYFGNGATYDAVQGNFRKFKQRIEDVKAEVGDGGGAVAPVVASRAKGKGKKMKGSSSGDGVLSGRVVKSVPKVRATKVKEEQVGEDEGAEMEEGV
ncbi:splicing arginine serine-rich 2 [Venturia nashicola]|uniref:Splicing arginine serine-rich 2 n=1 Tax=Venturia nashicola TaxID=86259 RepID=A0A4Z1NJZ5_9PEZI|nr:splicing arginine serine-rich 2 [Venturia nashicola]